jgi:hypothetical protein
VICDEIRKHHGNFFKDQRISCSVKALSMSSLIMVILSKVSSFNSEGAVARPQCPPPLVVASLDLMHLSRV